MFALLGDDSVLLTGVDGWEGHRLVSLRLTLAHDLSAVLQKHLGVFLKTGVNDLLTAKKPRTGGAEPVGRNPRWAQR